MAKLISIIRYIATRSFELKNTIPEAYFAPIEFVCVFCQKEKDYRKYIRQITELGKVVERTSTGDTYLLTNPLETMNGFISLVKIRKPDPKRKEAGDADFNTDYKTLKEKYENDPNFEIVKRDNFEMLRLSNPNSDVMACFSNIPKSKVLGITQK